MLSQHFMRPYLILILIFLYFNVSGQKVGLVLSGGGAKGLAHVGVIKALEENDIPIDYVVGTSMGGIIGGCYAAGMSPNQIEAMVLSDQFLRWINGSPEEGFNYYYHKNYDYPSFVKLDLSLDSTLNVQFNSTIANDVSLNYALTEQMAQASAISNNNFDSLFIPLRVVAADIFTQNQVILSKGSLSDALRATQTVPFFYNPIKVDGRYLFDGGVYNNFPVDVAQNEFKPDLMIGVNVSSKVYTEYPYGKDDKLISHSLLYLLLDNSDPEQLGENGIYIQPDLKGYTSFDFRSAKSLIDSGYAVTIQHIDEIKAKIGNRRSCEEVADKRNAFNNRNRPFAFDGLRFRGFNEKQAKYINRVFHIKPQTPRPLSYRRIKQGYFKLVSEDYFGNVYPNILYDTLIDKFYLQLSRRPQRNFQIDFGGIIATRDISNMFLGLNYYYFNRTLIHTSLAFQSGNFYKSAEGRVRIDYPHLNQIYLEPIATISAWNFIENEDLLQNVRSTVLKRVDRKLMMKFGWPISTRFKGEISAGGISNLDRYSNKKIFVSSDTLDKIKLSGFKAQFSISTSSLNRKQYPSSGRAFGITASYFSMKESFYPGNTSIKANPVFNHHQWFRLEASAEQYFNKGFYKPGYLLKGVLSNQPVFQNYFGTIINTPAFSPLQDSPTIILENFRSFNYLAAGIRNIFTLRSKLDLRLEAYIYKPLEYLAEDENQEVTEQPDLTDVYLAATVGLVHHSPIGPISLSVNYYDDNENQLGVLLHVGFLLFNKHSME